MDDILDLGLGFSDKPKVNAALRDYALENYDLSDPDIYGREAAIAYNAMESAEVQNKMIAQNALLKMKMLNRIQKAYGRESLPLSKKLYELSLEEADKLESVGESNGNDKTKENNNSEKKEGFIRNFFSKILKFLQNIWDWIKRTWQKFIGWIRKLFGKSSEDESQEEVKKTEEAIQEIKKTKISPKESLEETSNKIFNILDTIFGSIKGGVSAAGHGIATGVSKLYNLSKSTKDNLFSELKRIAEEKEDTKRYNAWQKAQEKIYKMDMKAEERAAALEEARRIAEEKEDTKRYNATQKAQQDAYNREVKAEQKAAKLEGKREPIRKALRAQADKMAQIIHAYMDSSSSKNCQVYIDDTTLDKMESFIDSVSMCINKLVDLMNKYLNGVGHDVDIGLKSLWKEIQQKFGSTIVRDGSTEWKYSISFNQYSKEILSMIFGKDKIIGLESNPLEMTDYSNIDKTIKVINKINGKFTKIESKFDKTVANLQNTGKKVCEHDVKSGGSKYPTIYADLSKSLSFFVKTTNDFVTKPLKFVQEEMTFLVKFGEALKEGYKIAKKARKAGVEERLQIPS